VASKPLFIAGADWPRLARRLQVEHVLRVDAAGAWQVSEAMQSRLKYVGGRRRRSKCFPETSFDAAERPGIA
jgi:thiamine biosynthesis lipoprotein